MTLRLTLAALALALPCIRAPAAEAFGSVELSVARPVAADQAVELHVATGALPRGARLVVSTESGAVLGAVSPFPPGSPARATVPVPPEAMQGTRVRLRIQVIGPGTPGRAPQSGEVTNLALVVQ